MFCTSFLDTGLQVGVLHVVFWLTVFCGLQVVSSGSHDVVDMHVVDTGPQVVVLHVVSGSQNVVDLQVVSSGSP